jgi:hypothetical protein
MIQWSMISCQWSEVKPSAQNVTGAATAGLTIPYDFHPDNRTGCDRERNAADAETAAHPCAQVRQQ